MMNDKFLMNQLDKYSSNRVEIEGDTIIYVYPKNNDGSSNLDVELN